MKAMVVLPLLATIFLIFFFFSGKHQVGSKGLLHRRLAHMRVAFDPLIEKFEGRGEQGAGFGDQVKYYSFSNGNGDAAGQQHSDPLSVAVSVSDEEEYDVKEFLTDGGQFNVTERLIYLFHLLDRWPMDELISHEELEQWIIGQAMDRMAYRTEREVRAHDKDGDGAITLTEYLSQLSHENKDDKKISPDQVQHWKEQFANADSDGDGLLNYSEYKDIIYPEDSGKLRVQQWLWRDKLRKMDQDGDGRLNFQEFRSHAYELYKIDMELENELDENPYIIPTAEEKFSELDGNKDRFLTEDEIQPIMHHLYPGEVAFASYYTRYLMLEVDDDMSGDLSLKEMLNHQFTFYGPLYEDSKFDDEDDMHEELRR